LQSLTCTGHDRRNRQGSQSSRPAQSHHISGTGQEWAMQRVCTMTPIFLLALHSTVCYSSTPFTEQRSEPLNRFVAARASYHVQIHNGWEDINKFCALFSFYLCEQWVQCLDNLTPSITNSFWSILV
jgi:hypothetical protein